MVSARVAGMSSDSVASSEAFAAAVRNGRCGGDGTSASVAHAANHEQSRAASESETYAQRAQRAQRSRQYAAADAHVAVWHGPRTQEPLSPNVQSPASPSSVAAQ